MHHRRLVGHRLESRHIVKRVPYSLTGPTPSLRRAASSLLIPPRLNLPLITPGRYLYSPTGPTPSLRRVATAISPTGPTPSLRWVPPLIPHSDRLLVTPGFSPDSPTVTEDPSLRRVPPLIPPQVQTPDSSTGTNDPSLRRVPPLIPPQVLTPR